jgi:phage/plasmid-like protein (TIGR03299 family)
MPDNIGEMFYCGERPWHEKGNKLKEPATAAEALEVGGLNWDVELVPIQTEENPASKIRRRMAVVRADRPKGDSRRVLGVVHREFRPLQNREAVELFDALLGKGQRHYHTGGYLGNGEVIWLLAKLPGDIRVAGDDVVEPYMLFSNSHDGRLAVDMRLTTVRVVCQNTLAMAMRRDRSSHVFRRAHRFNPQTLETEAAAFYKICEKETNALAEEFQRMRGYALRVNQFGNFLETLLPTPKPPARINADTVLRRRHETLLEKVMKTRKGIADVFELGLHNSIVIQPTERTLWGALNAVTAFVDHKQEVKGDRYAHVLFGSGAVLKQRAYELALAELERN